MLKLDLARTDPRDLGRGYVKKRAQSSPANVWSRKGSLPLPGLASCRVGCPR